MSKQRFRVFRDVVVFQVMPFSESMADEHALPFRYRDYLDLVDWSGRAIRTNKKGRIPDHAPPILQCLGMAPEAVLDFLQHKPDSFHCALGPARN